MIKYPCQCCKDVVHDGVIRRIPGAIKMGRVLMEQLVCSDCHDECCNTLEEQIWLKETSLHATKCNRCKEGFGTEGPYFAHRKALETGDWVALAPVCSDCFAEYHDCCTKLMKDGGK